MPTCANCRQTRRLHLRGLCRRCYDDPAVRRRFPDRRAAPKSASPVRCPVPGCGNAAKKGRRGLCARCFGDQRLREAAADRRLRPLPVDAARRNAVLTDPNLCPVAHLVAAARAVHRLFGETARVDIADLVQVGWLALIRAAEVWDSAAGPAARLTTYAKRGVRSEMVSWARREAAAVPPSPAADLYAAADAKGIRTTDWLPYRG